MNNYIDFHTILGIGTNIDINGHILLLFFILFTALDSLKADQF